jgi:hypothetical protein
MVLGEGQIWQMHAHMILGEGQIKEMHVNMNLREGQIWEIHTLYVCASSRFDLLAHLCSCLSLTPRSDLLSVQFPLSLDVKSLSFFECSFSTCWYFWRLLLSESKGLCCLFIGRLFSKGVCDCLLSDSLTWTICLRLLVGECRLRANNKDVEEGYNGYSCTASSNDKCQSPTSLSRRPDIMTVRKQTRPYRNEKVFFTSFPSPRCISLFLTTMIIGSFLLCFFICFFYSFI